MSYPANAEQGQRMIDALSGNPVAPAGDVTKNRSPFNAEQAEVIIELLENGGRGGSAETTTFDNSGTWILSDTVQGAIVELSQTGASGTIDADALAAAMEEVYGG